MTEEAESGPIQANLIKEAWIKLAADKDVIHALRTLSNEEVRNSLLTDVEWREFVGLVSGDEGFPVSSTNRSTVVTHLIQTSFLVHLSVWFVLVSLSLSAWIWWFGMSRGWWGQYQCYKCNYPIGKKMSGFSKSPTPEERVSNVNYLKEMGSVHESTIGEKCDCPDCSGYQLSSHFVEGCLSTSSGHASQHSQISPNMPLEPSEDCEERSDPQDPMLYPARVSVESEKRKGRVSRKSSRAKRSSRSKSSKRPKRTKRQRSKTLNKLDKSASSLAIKDIDSKLFETMNGTTKFLAPWMMKK